MSTYAISDIRGYYIEFIEMLKLINFDCDDRLILVGNIIDNNNMNSVFMIKWLFDNSFNKVVILRGKNEEQFISDLNKFDENNIKLDYYHIIDSLLSKNISLDQLKKQFCYLPWWYKTKNFILANSSACISRYIVFPKDKYNSSKEFSLYSSFDDIFKYGGGYGKYNVFGNYSTTQYYDKEENKGKIIKYNTNDREYININCGIYLSCDQGNLGCICLDNFIEYYI